MRDHLWPASLAAFMVHGLMIAAFALSGPYPKGGSQNNVHVEVIFQTSVAEEPPSQSPKNVPATLPLPRKSIKMPKKMSQKDQMPSVQSLTHFSAQGVAESPSPVFNPPPTYPLEARRKKIQGVVLIRVFVTQNGTVDKAMTLTPQPNPLLEEAALKAIRQWRFKPGGKVTELEIPIEFKLEA